MPGDKPHSDIPLGAFQFDVAEPRETRRFGFLLLPEFTLQAFSAALDPLRIANQLSQRRLYQWTVYSEDGAPVTSSSGVEVMAQAPMADVSRDDHLLVCSGNRHREMATKPVLDLLRRHARFGGRVGSICTGASTLARAGLLTGRRFTLHWENQPAFRETFPELEPTDTRFEIDGDLLTCGGGVAASEMMIAVIEADYGRDFAVIVSEMCLSADRAAQSRRQRSPLSRAIQGGNTRLIAALRAMHENIEDPLSLENIAEAAGISRRQLERHFATYLGDSPTAIYRAIRLDRARALLVETDMPVAEIAVVCGFGSTGNFAQHYKARFGQSPSARRRGQGQGSR